jgi:hypothetical protein
MTGEKHVKIIVARRYTLQPHETKLKTGQSVLRRVGTPSMSMISSPLTPHRRTTSFSNACDELHRSSTATFSTDGAPRLNGSVTERHADNSSLAQLNNAFIHTYWG